MREMLTKIGISAGVVALTLAMGPSIAFATDNGGNGEGTLQVFSNASLGTPTDSLQLGQTYYLELENHGGNWKLTNIVGGPQTITFNFINPNVDFKGNPGNWSVTPTFSVQGTQVSGHPFVYKVTLPTQPEPNGSYTIEAGPVQMHRNHGEDEYYFSNDPTIGGTGGTTVHGYSIAGQLPEVPYSGVLPILALGGLGFVYMRRKKANRA